MQQTTNTNFRDLTGKVAECIQPQHLSGAGKPHTVAASIFNATSQKGVQHNLKNN